MGVEERLRAFEKLDRVLRQRIDIIASAVEQKIEVLENVCDMRVLPFLEAVAERTLSSPASSIRRLQKHRYAMLVFSIFWLDPNKIRTLYGSLSLLAEFITSLLCGEVPDVDPNSLLKVVSKGVLHLARLVRTRKHIVLDLLSPHAGLFNPLARHIIDATVSYYLGEKIEGTRIAVLSPLGGGKTTLCFYTIYTALTAMNIDRQLALEVAKAAIINDRREALEVLHRVTRERRYVPALILDDTAAAISKYWIYGTKEEKLVAMRIFQALKISREGIGALFFPSDVKEALAKAIRESTDLVIFGEKIKRLNIVATLWIEVEKSHEPSPRRFFRPRSVRELKTLHSILATVHPPLYIPDDVYSKLMEVKLRLREQLLEEAVALQRAAEEKEKGGSEESITEILEMPTQQEEEAEAG